MITIYSEKEEVDRICAFDYLANQEKQQRDLPSYEEINKQIQNGLKVFESIHWSKK